MKWTHAVVVDEDAPKSAALRLRHQTSIYVTQLHLLKSPKQSKEGCAYISLLAVIYFLTKEQIRSTGEPLVISHHVLIIK